MSEAIDTVAHQMERIGRMRDLRECVAGELQVAIARACELGAGIEEVADKADCTVDEVNRARADLAGEDLAELAEYEMDWVRYQNGAVFIS